MKLVHWIGILGLLAAAGLSFHYLPSDWGAGVGNAVHGAPQSSPGTADSAIAELEQRASYRLIGDLERFRDDAADLLRDLDELEQLAETWTNEVEPLRSNGDGRLLAANLAYAEAVSALLEKERLPAEGRRSLRRTVERLREPISERLETSNPVPLEEERRAELDEIGQRVGAAIASYEDDLDEVRALLASARAEGLAPGETLEDVLAADRAAQAARFAELEQQQRDEREAAELAVKEEKERLRARAVDPDTQRLYGAFLGKGHYECREGRTMSGRPKPVSVANLRHWDVLGQVDRFASFACVRDVMYKVPGKVAQPLGFSGNDRLGVSDYPESEEEWDEWERRMAEFNELVPTFLELGMLRP